MAKTERAALEELSAALEKLSAAADRPSVDALLDRLLCAMAAAATSSKFDLRLEATLALLCYHIVEGWEADRATVDGCEVPDRMTVARDLGADLPQMVERWVKEHGEPSEWPPDGWTKDHADDDS
jgi:hypothetical protein